MNTTLSTTAADGQDSGKASGLWVQREELGTSASCSSGVPTPLWTEDRPGGREGGAANFGRYRREGQEAGPAAVRVVTEAGSTERVNQENARTCLSVHEICVRAQLLSPVRFFVTHGLWPARLLCHELLRARGLCSQKRRWLSGRHSSLGCIFLLA